MRTKNQIMAEILESLNQAYGGCSQLIHSLRDPRWLMLREQLEVTKNVCGQYAEREAIKAITAAGGKH